MEMKHLGMAVALLVIAPLVGGFLFGIDRRLTARLQKRIGPPLLQPFYDVGKLLAKSRMVSNNLQAMSVSVYLATTMLGLVLLGMGKDFLVILFIVALGTVSLTLGAFSVKSPYSQIGAQRELVQMLAYEPLLVLMVAATYLQTRSFAVSSIFALNRPLLLSMPLFVISMLIVLAIKLHKSPVDISGSHHAHQELIRGLYTDFSGPQLAVIEVAHWYELMFVLGCIVLLWHTNLIIGAALALVCFVAVIVLDNITARLTWRWMLKFAWTAGIGTAVLNLVAIYLFMPR